MKVYIPQAVADEGVAFLLERGYEIISGNGTDPETIKATIADCDAILVRTVDVSEDVIEAGKKLKIIARHGVGYDNVDIHAAEKRGIWVTNTPQALSDSVAEYTLAMMLLAGKNILACGEEMRKGNYDYKNTHKGMDMAGKTLGILGFGRIGRKVAEKAHFGLGMKVITYAPTAPEDRMPPYAEKVSWETLFARSDFLTLHIPGGERNRDLIGERELAMMKPTATILNVARGEVLDESALDRALRSGALRLAVLDVQKQEPPAEDWPLYGNENVILTPHMASNTEECMARMALHAAWQIDKVLDGHQPDWPVNRPKQG